MFREIGAESEFVGGFNEMDQTQTDFTLSNEFLNEVSLKGLLMLMDLAEEASKAGINRKKSMSDEDIKRNLRME